MNRTENPLIDAVEAYERLIYAHIDVVHAIGGCAALDDFDSALDGEVHELIEHAAESTTDLSPRASRARLNAIWKDFMVKHPIDRKGCL